VQEALYRAGVWSGTFDAWSKQCKEWLTANAFIIDDKRRLTRVCFGIRKLPIIKKPDVSPVSPSEAEVRLLEEYSIKTGQAQAEAVQVLYLSLSLSLSLSLCSSLPAVLILLVPRPSPRSTCTVSFTLEPLLQVDG
jgi:hypothetical protein